MERNRILTLLERNFYDDIELFTIECVDEFTQDELSVIFVDYLVDYAKLDVIDGIKILEAESEREEDIELVRGEIVLNILVEGYMHWGGEEEYLGTEEAELCYKFCFEMQDEKVTSEITLEVLYS